MKALRGGEVTSQVAQEQGLDGTGPVMPASALTSRDGDSGVTLCGESAPLALPGEVGLQNPYSLHLPLLSPLPPPSTGPLGGGWERGVSDEMEQKHQSSLEHRAGCTQECTPPPPHGYTHITHTEERVLVHARTYTHMHSTPEHIRASIPDHVHLGTCRHTHGPHAHHSRPACTHRVHAHTCTHTPTPPRSLFLTSSQGLFLHVFWGKRVTLAAEGRDGRGEGRLGRGGQRAKS